jgi:manganese/zinc/iron transport system permease protein
MNPYIGQGFFAFFKIFFARLLTLDIFSPTSDEIQLLVLSGVALSSALVGTFLVLRRMTMLAHSLSHTILLGFVIAFLILQRQSLDLSTLLVAGLITGLLTTFLTEFASKTIGLQEDASIGLVFTSLFALGVILTTLFTRSSRISVEAIMGNVDALQLSDLRLVIIVLAANLLIFALFFKEFRITTFDPSLARTLGISVTFFNYLLMLQVSTTSIAAFRAVGVLMVLAFIVIPPLTARLLTHRLHHMLMMSAGLGVVTSMIGVAISRHCLSVYSMAISTSGCVVCCMVVLYVVVALWCLNKGKR